MVEAVFEEMGVKREIFGKLDKMTTPQAILATNTSYLDVNEIARSTSRPASVLGHAFLQPGECDAAAGDRARRRHRAGCAGDRACRSRARSGKVPVVVGVSHGFVGNRMLRIRSIEAERLLLEGALPQDVDGALTEFGFPMGPFAMSDLAGLDISWRMRKAQGARAEIADQLCEAGRFGQKTGKGFYIYESGSRTPRPDPEVEALIVATSKRLGVTRAIDRPQDDRRAADLSDDQRRRAHSRRGYRAALRRYRCDLDLRLRLPALARRADVLCRHGRPVLHSRPAARIRAS